MSAKGDLEQYRAIVEEIPFGFAVVDLQTRRIVKVNKAFSALLHYDEASLLQKTVQDISVPEDYQNEMDLAVPLLEGRQQSPTVRKRYVAKDGSLVWVNITWTLMRNGNGAPTFAVGLVQNVTEQNRMEEKLRLFLERDRNDRNRADLVQNAVYRISESALSGDNLGKVFRSIHGIISDLMSARNFYIALYDPTKDVVTFPYFVDEFDSPPLPRKPGRGLTEYVLRTGKPLLASPEMFEELVRRGEVVSMGSPSIDWLGVPLLSGEKTIGTLVVQTYSEGVRYSREDQEMLQFVSTQVAMTIERMRAQEQIAGSERKFRAVFENANDAIFLMDEEKFLDCNQKVEFIFGCRRDEILQRTPFDFSPPVQPTGMPSKVAGTLRINAALRGKPQFYEWRHTRLDGTPFDAEVSLNRLDLDGKPVLQAVVRDVSERKQVEDIFQKYEFIANATSDLMTLVGRDYVYEAANDSYCRAHGKRREEILGRTMREIWGDRVFEERIKKDIDTCMNGGEVHYQAQIEFPSFGFRIFDVRYYPYRQATSAITHAVVVSHDITERIQAEEQIKASLREKEVLLREVHHRVKNNLQVISSLLNLQSGYIRDQQTLEIFRESQNRIRTMALIHEKLYRSEDFAQVDFAEYIRGLTVFLFRSYAGNERSIKLVVDVQGVSLSVDMAIPCGLIINELVSNSLKHAFPGQRGGTITVRLTEAEGFLLLQVRDDGVGFPAEIDFRKTDSLGLQLVMTLSSQIGGTVVKEDDPGTSFTIRFKQPDVQTAKVNGHETYDNSRG